MRIAMANDHAGYPMKVQIGQSAADQGPDVVGFGTHDDRVPAIAEMTGA